MIRHKLERMGAPHIRDEEISCFLGEMRELRRKTDGDKKGELEKMYSTLTHLYKAFKMERTATSSVSLAIKGLEKGALETFKSSLLSSSTWIMIAFFYLADSGLLYRKYRLGKLTK